MMKKTKNWWVLEYSDLGTSSEFSKAFIHENETKLIYGTLDEAWILIQSFHIFHFYLRNKDINYFYCEEGKLIFCLPKEPSDFMKREFNLNVHCLKSNGTFDLKKQALLIKKFDDSMHLRRKG